VTILVVCLGKPRQEEWIAEHGYASGAKVCLAFGAAVDFLAGRVSRAPQWMANYGFEWAWGLVREPRRLDRRYLLQGPKAYLAVHCVAEILARGHSNDVGMAFQHG
jgi:N-acetylglucosaminyldiphosphoundecaprenol N-acetyl-beta-D-mannosaminyltransferase